MLEISAIYEEKGVFKYLEKRHLTDQYKKAKDYLIAGHTLQTKFKERNPKGSGIWSFRINKQFRALCVFNESGDLIVFEIDNHS